MIRKGISLVEVVWKRRKKKRVNATIPTVFVENVWKRRRMRHKCHDFWSA